MIFSFNPAPWVPGRVAKHLSRMLLVHGTPMERGNTKVTVDDVHDLFKSIPLKFPPNDEVTMLGQAIGTFIQWPKKDIVLLDRRPPSVHGLEPQDETLGALLEREPSVEAAPERPTHLHPEVSPNPPAVKRK